MKEFGHSWLKLSIFSLFLFQIVAEVTKQDVKLWDRQLLEFLEAAENGDSPKIRDFIWKGSRHQILNITTWTRLPGGNGDTPIHRAARENQVSVLKLILTPMKNLIRYMNKNNRSAIHEAVINGHLKIVETLLSADKSQLELRETTYLRTPLYLAAEYGHFEITDYLLNMGADMYARSSEPYGDAMAIHEAARYAHIEIVKLLHHRGCSLGVMEGWWHRIPLTEAVINGSLELVKLLVERGSDISKVGHQRDHLYQPIHWAAAMGHLHIVKFLIEFEPSLIDERDRDGDKPFHVAVLHNHEHVIDYFISLGFDFRQRQDSFERTALHQAAAKGYLNLVKKFIFLGISPYSRSNDLDCQKIPIHLAVNKCQFEVVEYFLEKWPDMLWMRDRCGWDLIELAQNCRKKDNGLKIISYLEKKVAAL